jgi:cytochrome oxidase Cu insertion factor (SCO1/SenC/PrrC family)
MRWLCLGAVAIVGAGIGVVVVLAAPRAEQAPTAAPAVPAARAAPPQFSAAATWPAGARPAPAFSLRDEHGRRISIASLRGRAILVTFIDPLCRNLCPLEARVLSAAVRRLPPSLRPVIVSVSVNPWADTPTAFAEDRTHWHLGPTWRWATGTVRQLRPVWRRYEIGVLVSKRTITGVTVRSIVHTEATYVVDAAGDVRAVYVYPFNARDVAATVRSLSRRQR